MSLVGSTCKSRVQRNILWKYSGGAPLDSEPSSVSRPEEEPSTEASGRKTPGAVSTTEMSGSTGLRRSRRHRQQANRLGYGAVRGRTP